MPNQSNTYEAAIEYCREGLPITLCRGKEPIPKGWPEKRWTLADIDKRFRADGNLNVGSRLGADANLIDFDCDSPEAERALLDLFDGAPPVAPTFASKRGAHRLFAWHPELAAVGKAWVYFGPLEVRIGAGPAAQSLLPPSVTDGRRREWKPELSLAECRQPPLPKSVVQRILTSATAPHRHTCNGSVCLCGAVSSVWRECDTTTAVKAAIAATLPTSGGQRHRQVFHYARHLKSHPSLADANAESLKPYVQWWHHDALPTIQTKPFEETWHDFRIAWRSIKYAAGTEPIAMIYSQALAKEPPKCAAQYEQPELKSLIALCRELQREATSNPFFLACRSAAGLIGVDHGTAARWLKILCMDGVLVLVGESGKRHRASEYRYLGD